MIRKRKRYRARLTSAFSHELLPKKWVLWGLTILDFYELRGIYFSSSEVLCNMFCFRRSDAKSRRTELARDRVARRKAGDPAHYRVLSENIRLFGSLLGMTKVEEEIFEFFVSSVVCTEFGDLVGNIVDHSTSEDFYRLLPAIIGVSPEDTIKALSSESILRKLGIIEAFDDTAKKESLSSIAQMMLVPYKTQHDLMAAFMVPSKSTSLSEEDFAHEKKSIDCAVALLMGAKNLRKNGECRGINILVYGPPGVGKTVIVSHIAALCGMSLIETPSERKDHRLTGEERLYALRMTHHMMRGNPNVLCLIDEAEDAFPRISIDSRLHSTIGGHRSWVNDFLEKNEIPTFWIANQVDHFDPAWSRRFSLIIELDKPPFSVRRKIIESIFASRSVRAPESWIQDRSLDDRITPADVVRVAEALVLSRAGGKEDSTELMDAVLEGSFRARGMSRSQFAGQAHIPYDFSLVNVNCPRQFLENLGDIGRASILMEGPPGTGKTWFAKHVADSLGKQLLVYPASSLLSMWVGATEKNIATMFRQAEKQKAVLLLDEAEGMMSQRSSSMQSWEMTLRSEILQQMERFPGIFLCATNMVSTIDDAAFRRFDLGLRFDFLTPASIVRVVETACKCTLDADIVKYSSLINREKISLGDVSAAIRKMKLLGQNYHGCPSVMLAALQDEVKKRGKISARVGFSA